MNGPLSKKNILKFEFPSKFEKEKRIICWKHCWVSSSLNVCQVIFYVKLCDIETPWQKLKISWSVTCFARNFLLVTYAQHCSKLKVNSPQNSSLWHRATLVKVENSPQWNCHSSILTFSIHMNISNVKIPHRTRFRWCARS